MKKSQRHCAGLLFLLLGAAGAWVIAQPPADQQPAGMKKYVGEYHVLYTDLPPQEAGCALQRLTAMVGMYRQIAPTAKKKFEEKLPVYLYQYFEDYRRSLGGERFNTGRYDGLVLRAALDGETFSLPDVWRVIQHEGWHQYSHRGVQGKHAPPLWLEEGLAEYFGAAAWKDGKFHPGHVDTGTYVYQDPAFVLQPGRLQRVRTRIRTEQFRPLAKLVTMDLRDWRRQTNRLNHDQVWSFVHFLLRADKAKRRGALKAYLAEVLRHPPKKAKRIAVFQKYFGRDIPGLQKEYETWWLSRTIPKAGEP